MKKIFVNFILLFLVLLILFIFVLSTIGVETDKFNKFIIGKASETQNISLELNTIKFKIDPKKLSLFLETQNPNINYRNVIIPAKSIKVYIDFLSILKSKPKINKTNLVLDELDITELNKLSSLIKPSNFKNILNNNIKQGKLISEIDIFLNNQGKFDDFIARGEIKNLQVEFPNEMNLNKTNLSFFADKNDILIKNIFGNFNEIKISEGDIKLNFDSGIKLSSNFNSKINLTKEKLKQNLKFSNKFNFIEKINTLNADLNNIVSINLDNTYKVENYKYKISGKVKELSVELDKSFKNSFINEDIKNFYFSDLEIQSIFSPKNIDLQGTGKYSINYSNFYQINFKNTFKNDFTNLKLDFEYGNNFKVDLINYKKKASKAKISLDLKSNKTEFFINKLSFEEGNNSFKITGLKFKENNFLTFNKIKVLTTNNDFYIQNGKKILIKGSKFDATNLAKFLSNKNKENVFKKISSSIEIDFKNVKAPLSEKLENFKLIGEIKKGEFIKISSKGDFGGNNFLDISMKKDKNTNKRYLEIYSDLTRPLLTEYSFFNGLSGGKLFFTSVMDDEKSISKLKIENFKVLNAPGVIQLLSLADLGGLVDLAEGEGLSFNLLEIDMEKENNFLKLNEVLALGPSMSVLMDGYQDENGITSLRGTLVPAKTLNKMISKIPVIGNIVVPKEVGEGLFGISFKMKGPKGKVKTTINPIRTLTPRFIQKIIDKNKTTK